MRSILKLYLKNTDSDLDQKKIVEIDSEHTSIMKYFNSGIYAYKNNYYYISYNPDKAELIYIRKSNFTLKVLRTIIFNSLEFENQTEYKLEIVTNIGKRTTKPKFSLKKNFWMSKIYMKS